MPERLIGARRGRPAGRPSMAAVLVTWAVVILGLAACQSATPDVPVTPTGASGPTMAPTTTPPTTTATAPPPGPSASPTTAVAGGLPTAAELGQARREVSTLSVRQLAGQLVVARYSGQGASSAAATVSRLHLAGVAVFSENVPSDPARVGPTMRGVASAVTRALRTDGRPWPAFIAVDQEGGPVARIGSPATELPAAMALGATGDRDLARAVGKASGDELRALGFTVVLGPDADVTIGPKDPAIGVRSPGSDPQLVAEIAGGLTQGYLDAGLIPTPKHFPGHGSVTTDSHDSVPVQRATLKALMGRDLVPFRALVALGTPAIMQGHLLVSAVDSRRPATVSAAVTTGLLRKTLGFRGLVVTDALEMAAISGRYGAAAATVLAVQAGADVLLMPADPAAAINAIVAAEQTGRLTRARLVDSAARIVATLRHNARAMPAPTTVGSHRSTAAALAMRSITQISGRCGPRLVGSSVRVTGGTATDRARFAAAAKRAGLSVGSGTSVRLLGGAAYGAGSGSSSGSALGSGDIVVSLDVPYGLASSRARVARIAAYGRTQATFDALVAVLVGKAAAPGRLPVAVGTYRVGAGCGT